MNFLNLCFFGLPPAMILIGIFLIDLSVFDSELTIV